MSREVIKSHIAVHVRSILKLLEFDGSIEGESLSDQFDRLGGIRSGLDDTPDRVARMLLENTAGQWEDPAKLFEKNFQDREINEYKGMVIIRNIPLVSTCEHHLSLFSGVCHIGYIPEGKVVGLSKFARLVEIFGKRLQVQERLTAQICHAIVKYVDPKGVIVVIKAVHSCMESRGVRAHGSSTITSQVWGVLESDEAARAEFLSLVGMK